jgi:hypothetical protein
VETRCRRPDAPLLSSSGIGRRLVFLEGSVEPPISADGPAAALDAPPLFWILGDWMNGTARRSAYPARQTVIFFFFDTQTVIFGIH